MWWFLPVQAFTLESAFPISEVKAWSQTTPIYFDEYISSADARIEAWRRKFEIDWDMIGAEPNRGHRGCKAGSHRQGQCCHHQNIDGLHQSRACPTTRWSNCTATEPTRPACPVRCATIGTDQGGVRSNKTLLVCDDCGGVVKTATISLGRRCLKDRWIAPVKRR